MSDDRYRCSFDAVADVYESGRPPYADAAIAWTAERLRIEPGRRVLDLAAGTGKLARQLLPLGADIVAVEPGNEMRAVLESVVREIESLPGTAEAIPLPAGSVDVVTVGQAFHWFRTDEALAEMHRVLRPGGGIALLWNVWDDEDPVLGAISKLLAPLRPPGGSGAGPEWQETYDRRLFGELELRAFRQERRLTVDALAEWVASTSAVATAEPADQRRVDAAVRELGGSGVVDLSISTDVVVADRV